MGYLKIHNLYRDTSILLFKECYALEKIHGTSAAVHWNGVEATLNIFAGGAKHSDFVQLFDEDDLALRMLRSFASSRVGVYGEAYGGKVQGMRHTYGDALRFVVFDVKVDQYWLSVPNAEYVATKLGLDFVPYVKIYATVPEIDKERDWPSEQARRLGTGDYHPREGVVLRPLIEVQRNDGSRIIAKHKAEAFAERKKPPKVEDPALLKVLEDADAIAEEWVNEMRIAHVLQKHPHIQGIEHTGDLAKAIVSDVLVEANGEIVDSKAARRAISKRAASLWRRSCMAVLAPE